MILGSPRKVAIGSRGVGFYDCYGAWAPNQPFVVIREATHEEWLACARQHGTEHPKQGEGDYYYEVSTD